MKYYNFLIIAFVVLHGCKGQTSETVEQETVDFIINEPVLEFTKKHLNNENLLKDAESYKLIKPLLSKDYPNCYVYKKSNDNSWISFLIENDYGMKMFLLLDEDKIYEVASYEGDGGDGTDSFSKWIKNKNIIVKSITKYHTEYYPNDIVDKCGTIINHSRQIETYFLD